jgi:hypothetical protein
MNLPKDVFDELAEDGLHDSDYVARKEAEKYLQPELLNLIDEVSNKSDISDETFLKLGDQLVDIAQQISNSDYINGDEKKAKKVFIAVKKATAERAKAFDVNTINKVVKVSRNEKIKEYRKSGTLPNRWGTLYLLTSLTNEQIDDLVTKNNVTKNITRIEMSKFVNEMKGKEHHSSKDVPVVTFTTKDGTELDDGQLESLREIVEELDLHIKIRAGKKLYKINELLNKP